MKIVAVSDIHCRWGKLVISPCDVLISAGDYSFKGEPHVVRDYHAWLNKQEAGHIISVQGNHEVMVERNFQQSKAIAIEACPAVHFIDEGLIELEGVKIWCSAITPWFYDWAWNRERGEDIKKHWDRIPDDVNILVTHGPPFNILDELESADGTPNGQHVGCVDLLNRIKELKNLDIHIFGHIHPGHGQKHIDGVSYYNASICDDFYVASNPVTEIDYV